MAGNHVADIPTLLDVRIHIGGPVALPTGVNQIVNDQQIHIIFYRAIGLPFLLVSYIRETIGSISLKIAAFLQVYKLFTIY